ncbi:hypothetical protein pb186bvf_019654 [Paramecium bursaria]
MIFKSSRYSTVELVKLLQIEQMFRIIAPKELLISINLILINSLRFILL